MMVNRHKKGFTLLEVMVASVIGAFIAMVSVGTLRIVTTAKETVDGNTIVADELRFAANMIRNDIGNLYRDRNPQNVRLIGTIEEGETGPVVSLTMHVVGMVKARRDEPEGDVYEVQYYLRKDEDNSALMRRVCAVAGAEDKNETAGGILTAVTENIVDFGVLYYDGDEWLGEWDQNRVSLPELVEVSLVGRQSAKENARVVLKSFVVGFPRFPQASQTISKETNQNESSK